MDDRTDERYEQLLAYIATHLPAPYLQEEGDGEVMFVGGDPGEVIVRLTDSRVIVEEFAVRLEGPHHQVLAPKRVGTIRWRRLPETALMSVVGLLIKGARESRMAAYRTCLHCGRRLPPESMRDDRLCNDCAGPEHGAVH